MSTLLNLAVAPVLIILFYIYIRDKYEHEPIYMLLTGILNGAVIAVPISLTESFLTLAEPSELILSNFYISFITASFVEELFKFIIILFFIGKNRNYNEPFDGIVYSVFISLGFAGIENLLYVFNPVLGGIETGIYRAFISVPAHGLFGIIMGSFYSAHKFNSCSLLKAFFFPFLYHGLFDFLLLSDTFASDIVFIIYLIYIWRKGLKFLNQAQLNI